VHDLHCHGKLGRRGTGFYVAVRHPRPRRRGGNYEELVELVQALAPEMIAANLPDAPRPYIVKVETRRELAVA
jgi:hypothetical protein